MTTMKAVRIHAYGGSEVLVYEDTPLPAIADDDVLIGFMRRLSTR